MSASPGRLRRAARMAAIGVGVGMLGCGAFNPAFLDLLDSDSSGQFATLENAPGHVVVAFVNNAEVDERLIRYLESPEGGGLLLTDAEVRALRPRMRFRVQITFANGSQMPVEFIDGSSKLIDPRQDAQAFPDLNQNDLGNVVVVCDVQRVEILPGSVIEVFIPVVLEEWQQRIVNNDQFQNLIFELNQQFPPQFRALQMDDIDADGNVLLRRNIGIRDVPAPVDNPLCGSVVTITVNGTLSVPFLDGVSANPSYDGDDAQTEASIGGRFEFIVGVQ